MKKHLLRSSCVLFLGTHSRCKKKMKGYVFNRTNNSNVGKKLEHSIRQNTWLKVLVSQEKGGTKLRNVKWSPGECA